MIEPALKDLKLLLESVDVTHIDFRYKLLAEWRLKIGK